MKVGFLGNVNNYPYILSRYFREMGHEVIFFVTAPPEDKLHRPEHFVKHESYPYPNWIREVSLPKPLSLSYAFPQIFLSGIIQELNTCDAVVLNDFGHGIKPFLKPSIPSISVFSGSDLDVLANPEMIPALSTGGGGFIGQKIRSLLVRQTMNRHREGIRQATMISYFPKGLIAAGDRLIAELFQGKNIPRFPHCHIPIEGIEYSPYPNNEIPVLFNLTRFLWKEPLPSGYGSWENKRNDLMVKGLARYYRETGKPFQLNLVEKGIHVPETKALIEASGISELVTWHKEMSHKDIFEFYQKSDLVFEQLGNHILTGGLYPMLVGRPVIGNGRPEIFRPIHGEDSPVCQASSEEEVFQWLYKLLPDRELRAEIGRKSREFVIRHFNIEDEAAAFAQALEQAISRPHVR
jgi:glycosyltransferase involved in cell wall biosynthesis